MRNNSIFNINLELLSKASDALARDGLPQPIHLDPQPSSFDVCLPTSDELIKCIMDEDVLGLYVGTYHHLYTCFRYRGGNLLVIVPS